MRLFKRNLLNSPPRFANESLDVRIKEAISQFQEKIEGGAVYINELNQLADLVLEVGSHRIYNGQDRLGYETLNQVHLFTFWLDFFTRLQENNPGKLNQILDTLIERYPMRFVVALCFWAKRSGLEFAKDQVLTEVAGELVQIHGGTGNRTVLKPKQVTFRNCVNAIMWSAPRSLASLRDDYVDFLALYLACLPNYSWDLVPSLTFNKYRIYDADGLRASLGLYQGMEVETVLRSWVEGIATGGIINDPLVSAQTYSLAVSGYISAGYLLYGYASLDASIVVEQDREAVLRPVAVKSNLSQRRVASSESTDAGDYLVFYEDPGRRPNLYIPQIPTLHRIPDQPMTEACLMYEEIWQDLQSGIIDKHSTSSLIRRAAALIDELIGSEETKRQVLWRMMLSPKNIWLLSFCWHELSEDTKQKIKSDEQDAYNIGENNSFRAIEILSTPLRRLEDQAMIGKDIDIESLSKLPNIVVEIIRQKDTFPYLFLYALKALLINPQRHVNELETDKLVKKIVDEHMLEAKIQVDSNTQVPQLVEGYIDNYLTNSWSGRDIHPSDVESVTNFVKFAASLKFPNKLTEVAILLVGRYPSTLDEVFNNLTYLPVSGVGFSSKSSEREYRAWTTMLSIPNLDDLKLRLSLSEELCIGVVGYWQSSSLSVKQRLSCRPQYYLARRCLFIHKLKRIVDRTENGTNKVYALFQLIIDFKFDVLENLPEFAETFLLLNGLPNQTTTVPTFHDLLLLLQLQDYSPEVDLAKVVLHLGHQFNSQDKRFRVLNSYLSTNVLNDLVVAANNKQLTATELEGLEAILLQRPDRSRLLNGLVLSEMASVTLRGEVILPDLPPSVRNVMIRFVEFGGNLHKKDLQGVLETDDEVIEFVTYAMQLPYNSVLVKLAGEAAALLGNRDHYFDQRWLVIISQGDGYEGKKLLDTTDPSQLYVKMMNSAPLVKGVLVAFSTISTLSGMELVRYKSIYFLALRAYFYHQCLELIASNTLTPETFQKVINSCGYDKSEAASELVKAIQLLMSNTKASVLNLISTAPGGHKLTTLSELPEVLLHTGSIADFVGWDATHDQKVRALELNRALCEEMLNSENILPEFYSDILRIVAGLEPQDHLSESPKIETLVDSLNVSMYNHVPVIAKLIDTLYPVSHQGEEVSDQALEVLIGSLDFNNLGETIYIVRSVYYIYVDVTGNANDAVSMAGQFFDKLTLLAKEKKLSIGYLSYLASDSNEINPRLAKDAELFILAVASYVPSKAYTWDSETEELLEGRLDKDLFDMVCALLAVKFGRFNSQLIEKISTAPVQGQFTYILNDQLTDILRDTTGLLREELVYLYHTGDVDEGSLTPEQLGYARIRAPKGPLLGRFSTEFPSNFSISEIVAGSDWQELRVKLSNYEVPQQPTLNKEDQDLMMKFIFSYEKGLLPRVKKYKTYVDARRRYATLNANNPKFIKSLVNQSDLPTLIYLIRHSLIDPSLVAKYIQKLTETATARSITTVETRAELIALAKSPELVAELESLVKKNPDLAVTYLANDYELLEQLLDESGGLAKNSPLTGTLIKALLYRSGAGVWSYKVPDLESLPSRTPDTSRRLVSILRNVGSSTVYPRLQADLPRINLLTASINETILPEDVIGSLLLDENPDAATENFLSHMIEATAADINTLLGAATGVILGENPQVARSFEGEEFNILLPDKFPKGKFGILRSLVCQFLTNYQQLNTLNPELIKQGVSSRYAELVKCLELLFELQLFDVIELRQGRDTLRQHILIQIAQINEIEPSRLNIAMVIDELKSLGLGVLVPHAFWQAGIDSFKPQNVDQLSNADGGSPRSPITWDKVNQIKFPDYQQLLPDAAALAEADRAKVMPLTGGLTSRYNKGRSYGPGTKVAGTLLENYTRRGEAAKNVRYIEAKLLRDLQEIEVQLNNYISNSRSIKEPTGEEQNYIAAKLVEFAIFVQQNPQMFNRGQTYIQISGLFNVLIENKNSPRLHEVVAGLYKGRESSQALLGKPIFSWVLMLANEANKELFQSYVREKPENFLMLLRYMLVGIARHIVVKNTDAGLADLLVEPPALSDTQRDLQPKLVLFAQQLCEEQVPLTPQQRMLPVIKSITSDTGLAAQLQINPSLDTITTDWILQCTQVFDQVAGKLVGITEVERVREQMTKQEWEVSLIAQLELGKSDYKKLEKALAKQLMRYGLLALAPIILMIATFLFSNKERLEGVLNEDQQGTSEDDLGFGLDIGALAEHYQQYTPESLMLENIPSRIVGKVLHNSLGVTGGSGVNLIVPFNGQIVVGPESMTGRKPPLERLEHVDQLRVLPEQSFVYTIYAPKTIWPSDWSRKINKLILLGDWEADPEYDIYGNLIVADGDIGKRLVVVEVANEHFEELSYGMRLVADPYTDLISLTGQRGENVGPLLLNADAQAVYNGIYSDQPSGLNALNALMSLQSMLWNQLFSQNYYSLQLPMESETNQQLMLQVLLGELTDYYCTVAGNVSGELYGDLGYPVSFVNSSGIYIYGGLMITDNPHRTIRIGPLVIDNTPGKLRAGSTLLSGGTFDVEIPDVDTYVDFEGVLLELQTYLKEVATENEFRDKFAMFLIGGGITMTLVTILLYMRLKKNRAKRNHAQVVLQNIELVIKDPKKVYELPFPLRESLPQQVIVNADKIVRASQGEPVSTVAKQIAQVASAVKYSEVPPHRVLDTLGDVLIVLAFYNQMVYSSADIDRIENLVAEVLTIDLAETAELEKLMENLNPEVRRIQQSTGVTRLVLDESIHAIYKQKSRAVREIIDNTEKLLRVTRLAKTPLLPFQVQNARIFAELGSKRDALLTRLNARIRSREVRTVNVVGKAVIDILQLGQ